MTDTPTQPGTFKRWVAVQVQALQTFTAHWGSRWVGGAYGIIADCIAEATNQALYARLPGHPQQAPDSLAQVGADRGLFRFRGETDANWLARVSSAWSDYAQSGTPQQMLRVINQWGKAGWPGTWVNLASVDETTYVKAATPFVFQVTIPYGSIVPPWTPTTYGSGHNYGEAGLYYGIGPSSDIPIILYLVHKWKPSRCLARVQIFWGPNSTDYVIFFA